MAPLRSILSQQTVSSGEALIHAGVQRARALVNWALCLDAPVNMNFKRIHYRNKTFSLSTRLCSRRGDGLRCVVWGWRWWLLHPDIKWSYSMEGSLLLLLLLTTTITATTITTTTTTYLSIFLVRAMIRVYGWSGGVSPMLSVFGGDVTQRRLTWRETHII